MILGICAIIFGIIYIIKPTIFTRGIWKRTSITQNTMPPKTYNIYMRVLGGLLIVVGFFLIIKNK